MRYTLAVVVAMVTLSAGVLPAPTRRPSEPSIGRIEAYLRERMHATRTPGVAYAVVSADTIRHIGGLGHDGNGDPVTGSTAFLWGSVSKPITATAVMTLVESGAIDLDEPVRRYLPSFTLADALAAERITVRHLLNQASGIPEGTGITDRFDHRADPYGDAVAALAGVERLFDPGERHEYTSANYVVLGAVVESVTGQRFGDYLREHVLEPLAMAGAITTREEAAERLPGGHGYVLGQPVGVVSHYDQAGASYGYLGGTAADLAHFAVAQLNGGRYRGSQVLGGDAVELMQRGTVRLTHTHRYGLGWRDDERNADLGTSTIWHGGAVRGYHAMVVLLPDLDLGVVVLQNAYGVFQDGQLAAAGMGAARLLAGGEPTPAAGDPQYPLLLTVLGAVLVVVAMLLALAVYRLFRPTSAVPGRGLLAITLARMTGSVAVACAAGVVLPSLADANLRLTRMYAPDVGWLLTAIIAVSLVLAAVCLVNGVVSYTRMLRTRT